MALTAIEIANTTPETYDIQYKYYTYSGDYSTIATSVFSHGVASPWTVNGDVITAPTNWTDISDDVYQDGDLTYDWRGSSLVWTTRVRGKNYSASLMDKKDAIACLRKIDTTTGSVNWVLDWLGQITGGEHNNDYRNGMEWSREITGTNFTLEGCNSPRVTAGPANAAAGKAVTVSSTLSVAQTSAEAGKNEFIGTTCNPQASNITDSNLSTVWMSATPPVSTVETDNQGEGGIIFSELFFYPTSGYTTDRTWWIGPSNADYPSTIHGRRFLYIGISAL